MFLVSHSSPLSPFSHLHIRMLEADRVPNSEGSGTMLFQLLKSLLMILPQSTCYNILKDRLNSISRFRQSTLSVSGAGPLYSVRLPDRGESDSSNRVEQVISRVEQVRSLHCTATWQTIRADSLEIAQREKEGETKTEEGADRRAWLGYATKAEEDEARRKYREAKKGNVPPLSIEEIKPGYQDLGVALQDEKEEEKGEEKEEPEEMNPTPSTKTALVSEEDEEAGAEGWKTFWSDESLKPS